MVTPIHIAAVTLVFTYCIVYSPRCIASLCDCAGKRERERGSLCLREEEQRRKPCACSPSSSSRRRHLPDLYTIQDHSVATDSHGKYPDRLRHGHPAARPLTTRPASRLPAAGTRQEAKNRQKEKEETDKKDAELVLDLPLARVCVCVCACVRLCVRRALQHSIGLPLSRPPKP